MSVQKRKLTLDLKGHQYNATLRPGCTFFVIDVQSRAKDGEARVSEDYVSDLIAGCK